MHSSTDTSKGMPVIQSFSRIFFFGSNEGVKTTNDSSFTEKDLLHDDLRNSEARVSSSSLYAKNDRSNLLAEINKLKSANQ